MGATQVLAPVFVQVALTFVLFLWMGRLRFNDVRSGEVRPVDVVLGQPNWSTKTTQLMNAFLCLGSADPGPTSLSLLPPSTLNWEG